MNFSTFFSIFHKVYSKHFVMGMKSVNSWNKSHIFLFLAPISTVPSWWGHQQTGGMVLLARSLIKIMCTLSSFFCISSKEFSAYRIKKIVALKMGYTLGSSRMHFQKRISRRGKVGQLFSPPFLYFQNEMTVIGKNQDSRMSKDFVMECRRGLDFCVFLSGIW